MYSWEGHMAHIQAKKGLANRFARAYTRKWAFLGAFVGIFLISLSLLSGMGLVPEKAEKVAKVEKQQASALDAYTKEDPVRILIPSIAMDMRVENPSSTDVKILDQALEKGAVRYPTSARLGETGNMVLFGHSSYLPVVHNKAFKAFNRIQDLTAGERITVESNGYAYVYAVDNVYKADAEQDAIPLTEVGYTLTLVTCDSFATKSDRFIVTATLVESYPLVN